MHKSQLASFRLLAIICTISLFTWSCSDDDESLDQHCWVEIDGVFQDRELDEDPVFLEGGEDGWVETLLGNVNYPAEARENSIEGLCIVQYIISKAGEVTDIEVIQDPGAGIGQATINGINNSAPGIAFSPGILNGQTVRVKKQNNIGFKLEG